MSVPGKPTALGLIALMVGACATRSEVPEIPLLDSAPAAAPARAVESQRSIEIVEVPTPLPLPGQLKPLSPTERRKEEKGKDERTASERLGAANAAARVEPAKDGYINAIQVYPYAKGALYQLYGAVGQVSDV